MAVRIIIRRKFREGNLKKAHEMLIQARRNAMQEKGYISSETLSNYNDPNEIVVLSTWQRYEDWKNYEFSPVRQELEKMFAGMMDEPTYNIPYEMGIKN